MRLLRKSNATSFAKKGSPHSTSFSLHFTEKSRWDERDRIPVQMKRRVLVCGTNYGRSYLQALGLRPDRYELAGILARGSARSGEAARRYSVPRFFQVEQLPPGIDFACVAVGTSAFEVVLGLLKRGIHVLCEHPQKTEHIRRALEIAASRSLCFHINGHFGALESGRAFIQHCLHLRRSEETAFLDVTATDRSLYAAIDILRQAVGGFGEFDFAAIGNSHPFTVLRGQLGARTAIVKVQSSTGADGLTLPDGSPEYLADLRLAVGFPAGILTLLSLAGPVVWNSNQARCAPSAQPLWSILYGEKALNLRQLHRQRIRANLHALDRLVRHAQEHVIPPEQTPEHILDVSGVWESLCAQLRKSRRRCC